MTTAELKKRLVDLLELEKKDQADDILWAINEICTNAVESGDVVTWPGVGKLSCTVKAARKARNPRTGEAVNVPAKVAVKFTLAKPLKESAPKLSSKVGKKLLQAAEEKQEAANKRKRKREKEAAKEATKSSTKKASSGKKKKSSSLTKVKQKKSKSSTRT